MPGGAKRVLGASFRDPERRIAAFELDIESPQSLFSAGGSKCRAEVSETGPHLALGPRGPVMGALAGRPVLLQAVGLLPEARRPLKERGVGLRVGPYRFGGPGAQAGVGCGILSPASQATGDPPEGTPYQ